MANENISTQATSLDTLGYKGSIKLISGLVQANNGTFPLVASPQILVGANDERLDARLESLASGISGAGTNYTTLKSTVDGHTTKITALETLTGTHTTDITSIKSDVSTMGNTIKTIQSDITTLKTNTAVDTTLAISGRPADAKAVGDKISTISTSIGSIKTTLETLTDTENYLDATLTKADKPAQAKAVGDKVTELNTTINTGIQGIKTQINNSIDKTLTKENGFAEAKTVGDKFTTLTKQVDQLYDKDDTTSEMLNDIIVRLDDLEYVPANITAFNVKVKSCAEDVPFSGNTALKGSTITSISASFSYEGKCSKLLINDGTKDNDFSSKASGSTVDIQNLSLKSNTTFTAKLTDNRSKTVTKSMAINFYNNVMYGSDIIPTTIDSDFIQGLSAVDIKSSRVGTITQTIDNGEYFWFACPTSYGTASFNVGGFDGGITKVSTIQYTNEAGYTESYDVYRSDNANLGKQTIKVS